MVATRPDASASALRDTALPEPEPRRSLGEAVARDRVRAGLFGETTSPTRVGRFALLYPLGSGAMGAVYAAYDETLDRKVAIKVLHHRDDTADAALLKEARSLARVVHPNVVAVHEVGDDPDGLYLAMEFVRGEDLATWMQTPRSWQACLDVFVPAGQGLSAAHAAGVTHRDFKPANVLLSDDGRVRVVDFGLAGAAVARASTAGAGTANVITEETSGLVGTPAYMAHECWGGGRIGESADQFAFCVSAFEALHGCRPFDGTTPKALAAAVSSETLQPPPRPERVPKWLHAAIIRGLKRDPAARWPSMDALLAELARGRRATPKRWPWVSGAMVLGAAGTLGLLALGRSEGEVPCREGHERVDGLWTEDARTEVATAFAAAEPAFGAQAWRAVVPAMDAYAREWSREYTGICEATHVHGELSVDKLDLRMRCLARRWRRFDVLLSVFKKADSDVVLRAASATARLPSIGECVDATEATPGTAPPADESIAAVQGVRLQLDTAQAQLDAGRYDAAMESATKALTAAEQTAYGPVQAEALWQRGNVQMRIEMKDEAISTFEKAYYLAYEIGFDELAGRSAQDLVFALGGERAKFGLARQWGRLAAASLTRVDAPKTRWATLWSALGVAHLGASELDRAIEYTQSAVNALDDSKPLMLATALNNLGTMMVRAGRSEAAIPLFRQAVALREKHQSEDHPQALQTINALAAALSNVAKYDEADVIHQRLLAAYGRIYGEAHPRVASVLNNRAIAYNNAGRLEDALAAHSRALKIREEALGKDDSLVAYSLVNMAVVLRGLGRSEEAIAHARRGRDIFEATLGPDHERTAVVTRNLGSLYDEVGDLDAAVAAYTQAIKILERSSSTSANLASYRGDLGRVLRTQGRLDASLAATTAATEQLSAMDPAPVLIEVPVLVAHAQTLLAMDRRDEARAAATRAIDMLRDDRPKHAGEALSVLAKIEHADGSPSAVVAPLVERAAKAFERAPPNIRPQAKQIRAWWTSVSQAPR